MEMREEMDSITKMDNRNAAINEMNDTMDNMSTFISGVHTHQQKTVLTLKKLEALMAIDKPSVFLDPYDNLCILDDQNKHAGTEWEIVCEKS